MNKKILIAIASLVVVCIAIFGVFTFFNRSNGSNEVTDNEAENQNTISEANNTVTDTTNTLILYFSMSGNTETVANYIHDQIGGDIIKLETEQTYPEDYDELVDYARDEQRENARPALATVIENINQYDTIFLGYPNWWGDMPMPIYTFLDQYDLSNKTIAPFITHGGSGLSGTPDNIQEEEPEATDTEGLAIAGDEAENSQSEVNQWLSDLGY
ncbi:flavodoxin [uncultured Thomasclavelia sp.]|uniref:flavodoxin n=1 Tax=uncultured Thomasclavelia sp. TaxID=3025759 RepID=UPI0025F9AB4D|nr:flavodoxin [uncultured Thomasclavelia sp.]